MSDLMVIVPTRGRPHNIRRLAEAIRATAAEPVDLVLVIGSDELEPYAEVYQALLAEGHEISLSVVGSEATYPQKLNLATEFFHGAYRYLALWNDDHVPETPGWDVTMKAALAEDPFGVAYANDGIWEDGQVPTAPVLTSSMFRALGWVALPGLHHILVDNVWKELAEGAGTLHWFPEVMIRHHHYTNDLAPEDDTYRLGSNGDRGNADAVFWEAWQVAPDGRAADIARLLTLWDERTN